MARLVVAILFVSCFIAVIASTAENPRPIIAVLSQPTSESFSILGDSYIAASYVKFLESAGARVVPLLHKQNETEIENIVRSVNGVLLPGGGASFSGQYWRAVMTVIRAVIKMNDAGIAVPIWGTCLGFEELLCVIAEDPNCLDCGLDSEDLLMSLDLTRAAKTSKMFSAAPDTVLGILATENVTHNNHVCGISKARFESNKKLASFFDVLSTNFDRHGLLFVSTMEAKNYPIYGVQWHPEKAA